jgi:hypothetical protein
MNAAGSCWIVVLMLLINAEAISRSAFNQPIIGVIELIEISVIGIVFMQLADSLRCGVFIRSDGLFNQVMIRKPKDWYVGVEGMFTAPKWPVVLIVVIAVFVTMIQFLIMVTDHVGQLSVNR